MRTEGEVAAARAPRETRPVTTRHGFARPERSLRMPRLERRPTRVLPTDTTFGLRVRVALTAVVLLPALAWLGVGVSAAGTPAIAFFLALAPLFVGGPLYLTRAIWRPGHLPPLPASDTAGVDTTATAP